MSQQFNYNQNQNTVLEVADQLAQKQPPSNQQISEVIGGATDFFEMKKSDPNLDAQGIQAISDLQGVLLAADQLNKSKNADEKLQTFITESTLAAKDLKEQGQQHVEVAKQRTDTNQLQSTTQEIGKKGKQVGQAALSILKLMIRSPEFRGYVDSFIKILQEIFLTQDESSQLQPQLQFQQEFDPITGQQTFQQQPISTQPIPGQQLSQNRPRLSEDQKHELSFRFLNIMRKLNQTPQFSGGLRDILSLFDELKQQSLNHNQDLMESAKHSVQTNPHISAAAEEGKKLVEEFTHRPVDPLVQKTRDMFVFIRDNERANKWFDEFTTLLNDAVTKPELLDEYEFTRRVEKLIDEAYDLTQDHQFKAKYTHIFSELRVIGENIRDDPDLNLLQDQTAKFLENFTYIDQNGNKQFNMDLVTQMRQLVVPMLIQQLDNIPVPPIHGSNQDYDYYFDNIVFSGREIIPEMVEIHTRSDVKLNIHEMKTNQAQSRALLKVSNIKPHLTDIHFKFDRKTFPAISDEGTANLRVEGSGITIRLLLELTEVNHIPHFSLARVFVDFDQLEIDIISAQHEVLIKMFKGLYANKVKMMIQDNIAQKIREAFNRIESGINELFIKYPPSRLKAALSQEPTQVLQAIQS